MKTAGWVVIGLAWVMMWLPIEAGISIGGIAMCRSPLIELVAPNSDQTDVLCEELAQRRVIGGLATAALGVVYVWGGTPRRPKPPR